MNNIILDLDSPKEIMRLKLSPENWRSVLYSFIESRVGKIKKKDLPYISEMLQKMQKEHSEIVIKEIEAQKATIKRLKAKVEEYERNIRLN